MIGGTIRNLYGSLRRSPITVNDNGVDEKESMEVPSEGVRKLRKSRDEFSGKVSPEGTVV